MSCSDCAQPCEATLCSTCTKLHKQYSRECLECLKKKIPPQAPDTMFLCEDCYSKKPNRKCQECKGFEIPPNLPLSVKVCLKCVPKEQFNCTTPGCKCTTDASWKKVCYTCWKMKK